MKLDVFGLVFKNVTNVFVVFSSKIFVEDDRNTCCFVWLPQQWQDTNIFVDEKIGLRIREHAKGNTKFTYGKEHCKISMFLARHFKYYTILGVNHEFEI